MAKARSGGGITGNKNVKIGVKGGSPKTNVVNPAGATQLGAMVVKNPVPLYAGQAKAAVPMGNALATNVGKGGPGTGRTVYPSGTQSRTPPAIPITGDVSQWPDKKG
jgi:hypothetical protein